MTPQLRFPEFTDEWQVKKLGDLVKFEQGVQVDLPQQKTTSFEEGVRFLRIENYTQKSQNYRYIPKRIAGKKYINEDEVAIVRYGATAGFIATGQSGVLANNLFSVRPNTGEISNKFLSIRLKQSRTYSYFQSEMSGGAMPALSFSIVGRYKIAHPSKPEQEKIADFLTAVDERIAVGEKKLELLETYKRGVMQKIFSQKIRFKDENGNEYPEWEEKKLGDSIEKNKKRNKNLAVNYVQSVSNKHGFVSQDEYFDGANIASKNTSNYFVIEKGTFAYNPSRINVGSLAYKTDTETSIVSPLYVSFKTKNDLENKFLLPWFSTLSFTKQMHRAFEGSVRDTLSYEALSGMKIAVPCKEEQQKIATFLATLDEKITVEKSKLAAARKFKKALLRRMFV